MAYVYKYIDKADGICKYVGIVYGKTSSMKERTWEHYKYDKWCIGKEWDIYYLEVKTRTDAEFLESHYINLYNTKQYYNIKKTKWGISELYKEEKPWKKFNYKIKRNRKKL